MGTSCTLALVAEDRRRRINGAIDVIETSKKLKSSRQYHGGGVQFALALEQEAEALPFPYEPTARLTAKTQRRVTERRRTEFSSRSTEITRANITASEASPAQSHTEDWGAIPAPNAPPLGKPDHFIHPVELPTARVYPSRRPKPSDPKTYEAPRNDNIISMIQEACGSREEGALDDVLRLVLAAYEGRSAPDNQQRSWIQATGQLCRTLQKLGRVEDATRLLQRVVSRGTLEEADYFEHSPLELIDLLLAQAVPTTSEERRAYIPKFDLAVSLFLPTFAAKPQSTNKDVVGIGRKLLERAFSAEQLKYVEEIYWRCLAYEDDNAWRLTESFITQLHESHNYQLAIRHFLRSYAKMSPPTESIHKIGNMIVEAVEAAHNYKVAQVLKALLPLCSGTCQLRTQWPMKLLANHWDKHREYGETLTLFNELMYSGLNELVPHSDCLYRIMIEISLEAGEESEAKSYFDQLLFEDPETATDVRILGRFALSKARKGDWAGVQTDFETIRIDGTRASDHYGNVFIPNLKVFAKDHTVAETEQFLRLYIDQLKVPVLR